MVAACGEPLVLRGRGLGGTSVLLRGQGVVRVAVVLAPRLPGWRRGGLCGVVAVRHSVLSAIGPQLPWAGSVGRPKRLVRRLAHDELALVRMSSAWMVDIYISYHQCCW